MSYTAVLKWIQKKNNLSNKPIPISLNERVSLPSNYACYNNTFEAKEVTGRWLDLNDRIHIQMSEFKQDNEKSKLFIEYTPFLAIRTMVDIASNPSFEMKGEMPMELGFTKGAFTFNETTVHLVSAKLGKQTIASHCQQLLANCYKALLEPKSDLNGVILENYLKLIGAVSHPSVNLMPTPQVLKDHFVSILALHQNGDIQFQVDAKQINMYMSALYELCHRTKPVLTPPKHASHKKSSGKGLKLVANRIQSKIVKMAMALTTPYKEDTPNNNKDTTIPTRFKKRGDSYLAYPLETVHFIRNNLNDLLTPISPALRKDIHDIIANLSSRVTLPGEETPSAWFRRSVNRDTLNELNKVGLDSYLKERSLTSLNELDACLLGSHLKYLIKRINHGLIPAEFQNLIKDCISDAILTLDQVKVCYTMLSLEETRFEVCQKLSALACRIFTEVNVDPITPINLAKVIPVKEEDFVVKDLSNLEVMKEYAKHLEKWHFSWGAMLANPVVFFEDYKESPMLMHFSAWREENQRHLEAIMKI